MLRKRKLALRKTRNVKNNFRRLVARIANHRKALRRHRSFFLITEQL